MEYYNKIKGFKEHLNKNKSKVLDNEEVASVLKETIVQYYSEIKVKSKLRDSGQVRRERSFTIVEANRDCKIREIMEEELLKRDRLKRF